MRAGDDIFWEINRKVVSTKGMLEEEYHAPTCRLGCRYDNAFCRQRENTYRARGKAITISLARKILKMSRCPCQFPGHGWL